tara:strand:- start:40572 stop:41087 length:516 start_codon:yes stop_codon:yes gene_type:complete
MKRKVNLYLIFVFSIVLLPNIFVMIMGIESFPYTCAPMFGHYIDDKTDLYLLKFEGENGTDKIDLLDNYGKSPKGLFIRHFFSKAYGTTSKISPFSNTLTDSKVEFNTRMKAFFENFSTFLSKEYNMSFDKINILIKKVDQNRNSLTNYSLIGFYNSEKKQYYSTYESHNK